VDLWSRHHQGLNTSPPQLPNTTLIHTSLAPLLQLTKHEFVLPHPPHPLTTLGSGMCSVLAPCE
jgi:hypothetical protein